jgi:hypothetical protein
MHFAKMIVQQLIDFTYVSLEDKFLPSSTARIRKNAKRIVVAVGGAIHII